MDLIPQSPLMQPVVYQGQPYFTSQYFHAQYLANSPHGGKYRKHSNFIQVIRAIPTFQRLIDLHDIDILGWKKSRLSTNDVLNENNIQYKELFAATGYQPIWLLNATAQLALVQHLEDEASQHISMSVNRQAARQATTATGAFETQEHAQRALKACLGICDLLGIPPHIGQQEAVKMVEASTGVSLRHLLLAAPAQDAVADDAKMLEPTDLAVKLWGKPAGAQMNRTLAALGWQVRAIGGGWEPTPAGRPHCAGHAWNSQHGTKSGYNYRWNVDAVRAALVAAPAVGAQT
jgi:hypothetical protein